MPVTFQQDIEPFLREHGFPKERAHSLGLRCCATFCYHYGCSLQDIELPPLDEFIRSVYQEGKPGAHELGVHHGEMVSFINQLNPKASLIVLDPLREHWPKRTFKKVGQYSGKRALKFFSKKRKKLNKSPSVVNCISQILDFGGTPIVGAIQTLTNGYIGSASKEGETPTHTFVVLDYDKKKSLFTIFDPDKRSFEDLDKKRPKEIQPVEGRPGIYTIQANFLEANATKIYNAGQDSQRRGGIIIGIFKD